MPGKLGGKLGEGRTMEMVPGASDFSTWRKSKTSCSVRAPSNRRWRRVPSGSRTASVSTPCADSSGSGGSSGNTTGVGARALPWAAAAAAPPPPAIDARIAASSSCSSVIAAPPPPPDAPPLSEADIAASGALSVVESAAPPPAAPAALAPRIRASTRCFFCVLASSCSSTKEVTWSSSVSGSTNPSHSFSFDFVSASRMITTGFFVTW